MAVGIGVDVGTGGVGENAGDGELDGVDVAVGEGVDVAVEE